MLEDLERLEKLEALILELQERSRQGAAIIVEGQRDRRALRQLGITGEIRLGTKKIILVFCEEVAREFNDVIILTDWDDNGNKLAKLMEVHLTGAGARVDLGFHKKIQQLVQKRIKDIESLNAHIHNLKTGLNKVNSL